MSDRILVCVCPPTAPSVIYTINTYTVSFTKSNVSVKNTSGTEISSAVINYGGSVDVKVTPSSGYYLSSVSCPSGYACTGYTTGATQISEQTVTITNSSTAGGTMTLSGAVLTLSQTCAATANGQNFTYSGVTYYKRGGYCLTTITGGVLALSNGNNYGTWSTISAKCPSGTKLPTRGQVNSIGGPAIWAIYKDNHGTTDVLNSWFWTSESANYGYYYYWSFSGGGSSGYPVNTSVNNAMGPYGNAYGLFCVAS